MKTNHISVFPRATEKAYGLSKDNIYVFDVPTDANKKDILSAIEKQFDVKTTGIKTIVQKGKTVRYSRGKRSYPGATTRKDYKKAYVTLAKGDKINIFDEIENAEAKAKAEKKKEKK